MGSLGPEVSKRSITMIGALSAHPVATAFAEVVRRVHHRYATEVVGEFRLCPFMNDPETAFGKFVVVLDHELDVELAADCVLSADVQVVHLIYPLTKAAPPIFERFGNQLHRAVAARERGGPVHAAFHPEMEGDASSAAKLVGLVRRAPDPFVQFVPEGLHEGGSQFVDLQNVDLAELVKSYPAASKKKDNAKGNFERLGETGEARLRAVISDIHADRDRSYAEFLDALGAL